MMDTPQYSVNFQALELYGSMKKLFKKSDGIRIAGIAFLGLAIFTGTENVTALIFSFFVVVSYVIRKVSARNERLWRQFAADNGWQVGKAALADKIVPLMLANVGHSRRLSDVITGNVNGTSFSLFTYIFTIGHGKHSRTYTHTVFQIHLSKSLPSFVLDSKKQLSYNRVPSGYVKVSLEGNFDDEFILYVPEGAEVDILSVISPDVMQTLMAHNDLQDIQAAGNSLWFVQSGDTRGKSSLTQLFSSVLSLMPDLYHRLKTYQTTNEQAHTPDILASVALTQGSAQFFQSGSTGSLGHVGKLTLVFTALLVITSFLFVIFVMIGMFSEYS